MVGGVFACSLSIEEDKCVCWSCRETSPTDVVVESRTTGTS